KDPAKRYPSALALADDLKRFRDSKPIVARPIGYAERGWRWCRRNPRVAGLAAALMVVVLGSLLGLTGLYLQAEANKAQAVANLELARANLAKASTAVDECFTNATEHPLLQGNHLQPVRRVFLQAALKYYQGFLAERPDDLSMQAELARNYYRVGLITGEIASKKEALEALRKAREAQEELCRTKPDDRTQRRDLARPCSTL